MTDCPRCGQNHYDMTRPTVPTCPFKPQRTGPGGLRDPDIVDMARLAQHDERYSTGALYGALADEIVRLRKALVDHDIEKILAMTDEECRRAGIAEFGSDAVWRRAMADLRDRMLKAAGDAAKHSEPSTERSKATSLPPVASPGANVDEQHKFRVMLERVSHLNSFRELNSILPEVRALLGTSWPEEKS